MKRKRKLKRRIKIFILFLIVVLILFLIPTNVYKNLIYKLSGIEGITEYSAYPDEVDGIKVHTEIIQNDISRSGVKRKIKYIVIHETDNEGQTATAKSHSNYLMNNNNEKKSWHYTVDENEIYHHLPDNEIGYHAGDYEGNKYGIGIEFCVNKGSDFDKTMDNAAKLVAYLLKEYNLDYKDIKMHKDFSGKDCPHNIIKNNLFDVFITMVKKYS